MLNDCATEGFYMVLVPVKAIVEVGVREMCHVKCVGFELLPVCKRLKASFVTGIGVT